MAAPALLTPPLCCNSSNGMSSSSMSCTSVSGFNSIQLSPDFFLTHQSSSPVSSRRFTTCSTPHSACPNMKSASSLSSAAALLSCTEASCVSLGSFHGLSSRLPDRRRWLALGKGGKKRMTVLATAGGGSKASDGRFYLNFTGFPFPLAPFLRRRTFRTEVQKGTIWLFEQEQALGFSNVTTNTRMTVIKLKSGGLWVHAPIGPTKECVQLLKELESRVDFIVLPTFAYEHKIFVAPFSRAFPRAQVWVAPRQWSWPLNLPIPFLGIFGAKVLEDDETITPWIDEIEHKVISCPEVGIGPYVEVAFFHKWSQSLLVTDAVIFVPEKPPQVVSKQALLAAAKNGIAVKLLSAGKEVPDEPIVDTPANRQKGWERMVLQILFLGPSNLLEPRQTFRQMSKKLIVSPVIKTLVYSKVPEKVKMWVDRIAIDWKFKQIIPCHFEAPVAADARTFRNAFAFIDDLTVEEEEDSRWSSIAGFFQKGITYPAADMKTLSSLDEFLVFAGAVRKTVSGKKRLQ